MVQKIQEAWKAVVALVAPVVTVLVTDAAAELEAWVTGAIASVVTAVLVWLTPNKEPEAS